MNEFDIITKVVEMNQTNPEKVSKVVMLGFVALVFLLFLSKGKSKVSLFGSILIMIWALNSIAILV